ncbi:hypothetical protein U9M48_001336 [Paspalum notatum var. saurae]|uniref:Uncharacterized protein n=1 Tax=Paspalum notatum var. saurae TaxID=547442 RepID=A0AAQ3PG86_PASNO
MEDLVVDRIVEGGIRLVRPNQAADLYEAMDSYLAGAGVTGVKVDVVHTLEPHHLRRPVYVSDSLGGHDFALLRRLVFPDGTVPRCLHYALPTRDCLFKNPLFDQQTALKIWKLNQGLKAIGAFNCQGAGWD